MSGTTSGAGNSCRVGHEEARPTLRPGGSVDSRCAASASAAAQKGGSGDAGRDLLGGNWCHCGLIPGGREPREFMEIATEHGGLAIVGGAPAAVGGRRPRLGFAATTTAAARPPAGVTGREQPSPGAQASAEQREADEREKIPRRGVG